jgi:hypothetical protein
MAQRRRKSSIIVSFLCPLELLGQIDAAVVTQKERTLKAPLDRSSWIRRAIERDLDHTRRGRRRIENVEQPDTLVHRGSAPAGEAQATGEATAQAPAVGLLPGQHQPAEDGLHGEYLACPFGQGVRPSVP